MDFIRDEILYGRRKDGTYVRETRGTYGKSHTMDTVVADQLLDHEMLYPHQKEALKLFNDHEAPIPVTVHMEMNERDMLERIGRFGKPTASMAHIYREVKKILNDEPPTPMRPVGRYATNKTARFHEQVAELKSALRQKHQFINRAERRKASAKLRKSMR
jgi:hypothetical protein